MNNKHPQPRTESADEAAPTDDDRFDRVNVRTWGTVRNPDSFPEMTDPRLEIPWLRDRPSFGIAFSGGGTRSASATLGQLRALATNAIASPSPT